MENGAHFQSPLSPLLLDELIFEILSWLPVKSLLRFRCVSKSWKSLISHNPHFIKLHLNRSPKNANLILTLGIIENDITNLRAICCPKQSILDNASSIDSDDGSFRLKDTYWSVGSCNGLICVRKSLYVNDKAREYWVRFWNPALRLTSKKSPCLHVNWLSTDQVYAPARFGFCYDDSSDTYKVVAVILGSDNTIVKVHSMGENCWKEILSFPAFPILGQIDGKFVSGTLNWLALRKSGFGYDWRNVTVNQLVIFSLDVEKETYKQLSLPGGLDEVPYVEPDLMVLGGCLCFCHYYRGIQFVIWQMKEFGVEKSWTQLLNISYQHLQINIDHPLIPMCTFENGDVVMANNEDYQAILYKLNDNRFERFEIPNHKVWMDGKDYVPSLVLPGSN